MIFLRLVYVLRVRVRGSKFDTYQSRACTHVVAHRACSDERLAIYILAVVLLSQLVTFLPLNEITSEVIGCDYSEDSLFKEKFLKNTTDTLRATFLQCLVLKQYRVDIHDLLPNNFGS